MNKKFDTYIEKFIKENKLPQNAINSLAMDIKSSGGSGAASGANELGKLAQAAANKANPNLQKSALEKLQALLDPGNKDVMEYTQIGEIPDDLKSHIQNVFKPLFQTADNEQKTTTTKVEPTNTPKTGEQYDPNQTK
jgi:hypothetical protein